MPMPVGNRPPLQLPMPVGNRPEVISGKWSEHRGNEVEFYIV